MEEECMTLRCSRPRPCMVQVSSSQIARVPSPNSSGTYPQIARVPSPNSTSTYLQLAQAPTPQIHRSLAPVSKYPDRSIRLWSLPPPPPSNPLQVASTICPVLPSGMLIGVCYALRGAGIAWAASCVLRDAKYSLSCVLRDARSCFPSVLADARD
eukprot:1637112-Rhodomonas_salina.1